MPMSKRLTWRLHHAVVSRLFGTGALICTLLGGLTVSGCYVAEPTYAAKLRPLIAAKLQAMHVPGAIVSVQTRDQGEWIATFGLADLKTQAPIDEGGHVRVGSITKTFTGTAILQLVDEGKLSLDDPVSKYQPEVPNGRDITIR
jgi:D-alanyl-D-alanine carboxypeptidase